MAQMPLQLITDAGTEPTYSAANTNDTAVVGTGHNTFLVVKNGSASSITVTLTEYTVLDNGQTSQNYAVTIPAGTNKWIPLRKSYDKGDGTGAQILYSAVATVTSALVQIT